MMSENTARRWFITGISPGFGRQLSRTVARSGGRVLRTVRNQEQVSNLASEGIATIIMDVNDQTQVSASVEAVQAHMGGVDVVVNNAGFGMVGAVEALSLDEIRSVMETNFFGALRVTQAFTPQMRKHGGTFVMISSMADRKSTRLNSSH